MRRHVDRQHSLRSGCSSTVKYHKLATQRGIAASEHILTVSLIVLLAIGGAASLSAIVKKSFDPARMPVAGDAAGQSAEVAQSSPIEEAPEESTPVEADFPVISIVIASMGVFAVVGGMVTFPRGVKEKANTGVAEARGRKTTLSAQRLLEKRESIYRKLQAHPEVILRNKLLVGHVMSTNVFAVNPLTPRSEIQATFHRERLHHLLVCDQDAVPLGVISDRDLTKKDAETAERMMSNSILSARVDDPIELAICVMIQNRISCLPVLESSGRLRGIITSSDLLLTLQCALHLFDQLSPDTRQSSQVSTSRTPNLSFHGVVDELVIHGHTTT